MLERWRNRNNHKPPVPQPQEQIRRPLTATEHCGMMLQKLARTEMNPASKEQLLHETVDHAIAIVNAPEKEREKALHMLDEVKKRDINSQNPTYLADKVSELIQVFMNDAKDQDPKLVFYRK